MPSIWLLVEPNVDKWFVEHQTQKWGLCATLREVAARELPYDITHVEVNWIPVDYGVNISPMAINVLYSVKPDFNPDEKTKTRVADKLNNAVAGLAGLPNWIWEVTAWILPQHEAVFRQLTLHPQT